MCLEIKNDEVFDLLPAWQRAKQCRMAQDGMPSEEQDVFFHRGGAMA